MRAQLRNGSECESMPGGNRDWVVGKRPVAREVFQQDPFQSNPDGSPLTGPLSKLLVVMVAALLLPGYLSLLRGQSPPAPGGMIAQTSLPPEQSYNPVADPRAMVIFGHARFTVLTAQMIRMEWAADGKFEDHASLVFINRMLPPPPFNNTIEEIGGMKELRINTGKLDLRYRPAPNSDGKFTAQNLIITFELNGKQVSWRPGQADAGNLMGTTRTLDGARGDQTKEPIQPGLISRDGWTIVDDSTRPLFDSADFSFSQGEQSRWPWVMLRPAGDRQDWYFFGYGHEYRQALSDYVKVAGRIPLPPRFAFGTWWSRYWAYSDQEFDDLIKGFHENDTPLDVLGHRHGLAPHFRNELRPEGSVRP